MIPYSYEEWIYRMLICGTVFELTRWKDGKIERLLLDNEEVILKELHSETFRFA